MCCRICRQCWVAKSECPFWQVSFIPREANCQETTKVNPAARGANVKVSGHIEVNPSDGSLSQTNVDTMLQSCPAGDSPKFPAHVCVCMCVYVVCVCVREKDDRVVSSRLRGCVYVVYVCVCVCMCVYKVCVCV